MSKIGIIDAQDLVNAFVNAVVEECQKPSIIDDYFRWDTHDETWHLRSTTQLWGSYWTIRRLGYCLTVKQSCELETKMDAFVHQYATALAATKIVTEDEESA